MLLMLSWIQPVGKLCSCTLFNFLFDSISTNIVYDGSACCFGLILGCKDYNILCILIIFMIMVIKDGKSALMMAAQGGHTETVKALIAAGADVNVIILCKQVIQMPLINDVV